MGQREVYLEMGFSYSVRTKTIKNKKITEIMVLYHDLDIYSSSVNWRINCDTLFINICSDFLKNINE